MAIWRTTEQVQKRVIEQKANNRQTPEEQSRNSRESSEEEPCRTRRRQDPLKGIEPRANNGRTVSEAREKLPIAP